MKKNISRRKFIKTTAAGTVAVGLGGLPEQSFSDKTKIPHRMLGKTGESVPILGFGTAPAGLLRDLKSAVALYHEAIDLGVNYMDTAPEFTGYGRAQMQLGHVLRDRRKEVFLITKCFRAGGDAALRLLEQNLKELQTDHADLVYAHSIGDDSMTPEIVMGKGGVMEALQSAQKQGLTRYIGVSGHNRPERFLQILERFQIDVMMNAVNFADRYTYNFEERVWPAAKKLGVGLVAMKVFGGGSARAAMPAEHIALARRYAWSQPEGALAVLGMGSLAELRSNVEAAQNFKPLNDKERAQLEPIGRRLAGQWREHFGPVV
jgi:aryl-alcohol dehydrogenase-like predicted oxidoreductase